MEIFPAIDILRGHVVRASRTDAARTTVYHADPFALAEVYAAGGARWVHVVDLDRAFGLGDQTPLVAALVRRLRIAVQVGGGLWREDDVTTMRDLGVQRVVLGVRALEDLAALGDLVDAFSDGCLALAIDGEHGRGWARDWPPAAEHDIADLGRRAADAGIRTLVHTDLAREGALRGANVAEARRLAEAAGTDVLVSGGIDSLDDLARVREAGLAGAVVGRALLDRRFTLEDALGCCTSS